MQHAKRCIFGIAGFDAHAAHAAPLRGRRDADQHDRTALAPELIGGDDYATFCANADEEERRRTAATIWRFMFRSLFKHGILYADPHPGNYRFLGAGKVAFRMQPGGATTLTGRKLPSLCGISGEMAALTAKLV